MVFTQMKKKYSICWAAHLIAIVLWFAYCTTVRGNPSTTSTLLLHSTQRDIRIINITGLNNKIKNTILIRNLTDGTAVDFNYNQKKICWTDHALESIQCVTYTGGQQVENKTEVVSSGVLSPDGLACDWITNKLYWTDSDTNRIEVATMTGQYRKVLFWTDLDQPRAIALDPLKGLMFWTDWGEVPKVERASMSGDHSTRKVLVSDRIFWPNGLTIDYDAQLIYWVDGKLHFIESMDYNGNNRKIVVEDGGLDYPYAITTFQHTLYWTDWKAWSILYLDENASKPRELINLQEIPSDIHVWDPRRQPQPQQPHPCQINNGNCSHLCLLAPSPQQYTCACPIGVKHINNFTCANGPQELLILARRTDICMIYLDSADHTFKTLPLKHIAYTIAVDYDPVDGYIYWTDDTVQKIQRAKLDGSEQEDVITSEIQHPDGLAIDWVSRNLYWTDTGTDRIEVVRLNYGYRRVIIYEGLVEPRAIAVSPELGWLFWSDWYEQNPKIERSNLDGSERTMIVSTNLVWPNGIALDLKKEKVYWCDAKTDKIEYANMDGTERRELINDNLPHPFGFSLMGDYLYWTDWQRRAIDRAHKETGSQREVIADQIPNVMGLKAIRVSESGGWNPCSDNNGNCSHICLYRHNNTRVCACQIDHELTSDGLNCIVPEAFMLFTQKYGIGRMSIENVNPGNKMIIPIKDLKFASSIDVDVSNKRIYWSDIQTKTIMRAFVNGSDPQKVIELGLMAPEGIAIDWLALNIYWSDPAAHRIEVARLTGTSRRVLIWKNVDEPHSIALDPTRGYMYWSELGKSQSIKKAALDGSQQTSFSTTRGPATSLTLDEFDRRLYWVEINAGTIMSSDLDGNDRTTIVRNLLRPLGFALYKDRLYWTVNEGGGVYQTLKGQNVTAKKIYVLPETATELLIFHSAKQRGSNQCSINNGACKHLCLALPNTSGGESVSYTCACPTHYTLQNRMCTPPTEFMIYSKRNLAIRLLPDTPDCPEAVLPVQGLKTVKAIDYDPVTNYLYWIEGKTHSIKRADTTGNHVSVVVQGNQNMLQPFDLALDAVGKLLFWSCSAKNVINVTRLNSSGSIGVVEQREGEQPRLLALHHNKRLLFYTDVGKTPQLVRCRLDGSHRITLVKMADILAIAVDSERDSVFFTQGDKIYMSNIEGANLYVLFNESNSKITHLTYYLGWLYWLDRDIEQMQRLEPYSGNSRSVVLNHASHIVDLIAVVQPSTKNPCSHTKHCSHLCILNGTSPVCACFKDLALLDDKKTCSGLPSCGADHFTCTSHAHSNRDCIPATWRCDGQNDCSDGSDEVGCPACRSEQFRCQSGECIDQIYVCDGIPHCKDQYDEALCCKSVNEFQCPGTRVCVLRTQLCDGLEDCADGSDEHKSVCKSPDKKGASMMAVVIISVISAAGGFTAMFYYLSHKFNLNDVQTDQSEDPLSPSQPRMQIKAQKRRKGFPDVVQMSGLNDSQTSSYDRNHITGASSSTNGSSLICYPRETLNPPPSPATTAASTRCNSPCSRYRPYRHYRSINQPPPPTPCSTDVCDESDSNYPTRRYDGGPFPPPPTPRSHCHSESCPPSPSSRSSTYFSPLPPPPSPVHSPPRSYDS